MRKESSTLQKCKRQMATLGFDSQLAYHRVKLILKIYRDVVWVLSERVEELHEYAWELGAQDADTGLTEKFTSGFAAAISSIPAGRLRLTPPNFMKKAAACSRVWAGIYSPVGTAHLIPLRKAGRSYTCIR